MIAVGTVLFVATFGLAIVVIWPVSMVWGAIAASNRHSMYEA